ncbi:MAG TPA: hypothetical protein VG603_06795, partial [Chitinophagales bacterium]|nr:hypothetical protein [Chitinophagales bacterium]
MKTFIKTGFTFTVTLVMLFSAALHAAPTLIKERSCQTRKADKALAKLRYEKAIKLYTKAMAKDPDTMYVVQRIADCYRYMGNDSAAAAWYGKLANNPAAAAANKLYYAQLLSGNKNYTDAKKYYQDYADAVKQSAVTDAMDKLNQAPKENTSFKV